MGSADIYGRNPARDVEQYAIRVVRNWAGSRGIVIDASCGHDVDFRIDYSDGRRAVGEVGWHQDPVLQEMWAKVFKYDRHQVIDLPAGAGRWELTVLRGSNIKRLYAQLPDLVSRLIEAGVFDLSISADWPLSDFADTARTLGIEHIARIESAEPSLAIFFINGIGGIAPTDPDCITDWVNGVLGDPGYQDTTAKLLVLESDERHVFLMTGDRTPFGTDERLRRLSEALPTRPPEVPDGISHVWAISRFGDGPGALWALGQGWSAVEPPKA